MPPSRALAALLFATSPVIAGPVGDPVAGRSAFAPCASCHAVGPSARAGFGPQLNGVMGRRAGSTPDFRYSRALRDATFTWTDARLAAYVRDPTAAVPGTSMRFRGFGYGDRKMADLVAYLRSLPAQSPMQAASSSGVPSGNASLRQSRKAATRELSSRRDG